MNILCAIGLHSPGPVDEVWTPSFTARLVTEFESTCRCRRCGKVMFHLHSVWNGKEFVDLATRPPSPRTPDEA